MYDLALTLPTHDGIILFHDVGKSGTNGVNIPEVLNLPLNHLCPLIRLTRKGLVLIADEDDDMIVEKMVSYPENIARLTRLDRLYEQDSAGGLNMLPDIIDAIIQGNEPTNSFHLSINCEDVLQAQRSTYPILAQGSILSDNNLWKLLQGHHLFNGFCHGFPRGLPDLKDAGLIHLVEVEPFSCTKRHKASVSYGNGYSVIWDNFSQENTDIL